MAGQIISGRRAVDAYGALRKRGEEQLPESKLKTFGPKAEAFTYRSPRVDRPINILLGSIRSGKTWAMILKLAALCNYKVGGRRLIVGVTKQTVYQNVLEDLFDVIGPSNYQYNQSTGRLKLFGVPWRVIGAKDEGSEKYIRGLTVGIAYIDELSLIPKSSYQMLRSRMSPEGSRLYATTNPDSPYHWLKADVLDNWRLWEAGDLFVEHFTMDDNPHLTESFKAEQRRQYAGIFYRRFILGEWILAEGSIYRDVMTDANFYTDDERPIGLKHRGGHQAHWVGIDDGTVNPYVFGDFYDDGNVVWLDRELYHDSRKEMKQHTNGEKADRLLKFMDECAGRELDPRERPGVIVDPSAASLKTELINRGLFVVDANNEVMPGISKVSSMLNLKKLRINQGQCPNTVKEMQTYAWDDQKGKVESGDEKPIKAHDHGPDKVRYVIHTTIEDWRLAA